MFTARVDVAAIDFYLWDSLSTTVYLSRSIFHINKKELQQQI